MSNVTWEFPNTVDELVECLKKDTRLVGGGTGLMRNVPSEGSFTDLSALGIDYVRIDRGIAHIGGAASFAETAAVLGSEYPGNIISVSLNDAACPSLRNMITIGGSVALFPPWGRVVGPLVALDAKLQLVGATDGTFTVSEYVGSPDLAKQTAIVEVEVDLTREWSPYWYRFSPVRFNYPLFTVVVLVEYDGDLVADCRLVLTGVRGRYRRLSEVEDRVRGKPRTKVGVTGDDLETMFPDRQGFSGEYLAHLAAVQVTRGLRDAERIGA
jgi:CO/xanthine dehydrogenase FAD-binding subunit